MIAPRLWDHHHGHLMQGSPGQMQKLHGVVELRAVGPIGVNDLVSDLGKISAEQVRL